MAFVEIMVIIRHMASWLPKVLLFILQTTLISYIECKYGKNDSGQCNEKNHNGTSLFFFIPGPLSVAYCFYEHPYRIIARITLNIKIIIYSSPTSVPAAGYVLNISPGLLIFKSTSTSNSESGYFSIQLKLSTHPRLKICLHFFSKSCDIAFKLFCGFFQHSEKSFFKKFLCSIFKYLHFFKAFVINSACIESISASR